VNAEALGLVTLVGLITIALSVYMITYSHTLYRLLDPLLNIFERKVPMREEAEDQRSMEHKSYDVILFGLGRYGSAIAEHLRKDNLKLLAVDFNPDEVRNWRALGFDAVYGDACDHEFIGHLPLKSVKWVVSAMPQHDLGLTHEDPRLVLIDGLKREKFTGKIAVSTQQAHEKEALKTKGADLVFLPFHDAADRAVERMREASS
jgi:voltage-gated potassium channel Kch